MLFLPIGKKFASQEGVNNDSPKYQNTIQDITIQGLKDKKLLKSFHDAVVFEKGPMSPLQFQKKLNRYVEKLTDFAHFYGYYDATVDYNGSSALAALFTFAGRISASQREVRCRGFQRGNSAKSYC